MRFTKLAFLAAAAVVGSLGAGCGARSGLYELAKDAGQDVPPVVPPECEHDLDCEGFEDKCNPVTCNIGIGKCEVLAPIKCDDKDPCTEDACDSTKGTCSFKPMAVDNDKDGHKGPVPGHAPGDLGSCGDDCDDTNAAAFPGNKEICDGVDNDCNKVVDDGATFVPANQTDVQVDGDDAPAGPAGLAYSNSTKTGYMAGYWGTLAGKTHSFAQALSVTGEKIGPAIQVTLVNADASGGALVWTGDRYGIAWNDRRNGDYEIYFNQIGPDGTKLYPDLRITAADGFSLYPQVAFNGLYFLIVWEDDREGAFGVYAQRVDLAGNLVGDNLRLTKIYGNFEAPVIAVGTHGVAVAWNQTTFNDEHKIQFQLFTPELEPAGQVLDLTKTLSGTFPYLVWNKQSYVTAWFEPDESPYGVYGSVIDESGAVTTAAKKITQSPKRSRYPSLLPLGDRVMMMYSDNRDNNKGYELYARMYDAALEPLSPETRITHAEGDSVYPIPSFGPAGDMGVLFRDDRQGGHHVYFTRLQCVTPGQ
ncbi:MAG: putative metal-binding motif-containing protein [Deltaproteobacteria bacterium]|nr:putative metal-binding motif-containing protein [Deltaproteobacteria bacterium]